MRIERYFVEHLRVDAVRPATTKTSFARVDERISSAKTVIMTLCHPEGKDSEECLVVYVLFED